MERALLVHVRYGMGYRITLELVEKSKTQGSCIRFLLVLSSPDLLGHSEVMAWGFQTPRQRLQYEPLSRNAVS